LLHKTAPQRLLFVGLVAQDSAARLALFVIFSRRSKMVGEFGRSG